MDPSARRVLVVDDNQDAAELLGQALERLGHHVRVAFAARSALAVAREFVPDVALVDIGLPVMDGYELAAELRALPGWRAVRLIAVTGYGHTEEHTRTQAAGFDALLLKPAELGRIDELVRATPRATAPACAPEWLERIAHDIRSPVGVLSQTLESLRSAIAHPTDGAAPDLGRSSAIAGRALRRLEVLADRLAVAAIAGRGPLEVVPQRVDLAAAVRAAIADVWRVHGRREVVVELGLPDKCDVRGDATALERAVAELVINAAHHAKQRVTVVLAAVGRSVRVSVEDDGSGVSAETAQGLFVLRGPSHGGLGIGLYLAQAIARAHGGEIVLESPAGQPGARFAFVVPAL